MLDTALDFSKDICGHIDVFLSMFIVKKYFLCMPIYYHHNDVDSEISACFLHVLTYIFTIISYNSLN